MSIFKNGQTVIQRICPEHPTIGVARFQAHCILGCALITSEFDLCQKCFGQGLLPSNQCDYPCLCIEKCLHCRGLGFVETSQKILETGKTRDQLRLVHIGQP